MRKINLNLLTDPNVCKNVYVKLRDDENTILKEATGTYAYVGKMKEGGNDVFWKQTPKHSRHNQYFLLYNKGKVIIVVST